MDFALGHVFGDAGNHLDDLDVPGAGGDAQGPGQEKIAHQNGGGIAPDGVGHRTAAAQLGLVDQIVVQQGGGMQVFQRNGKGLVVAALVTAHAGGQDQEKRTQALAAAKEDVSGHLAHELQVGIEVVLQLHLDLGQVVGYQAQDAGFKIIHSGSPTRSYSRVSIIRVRTKQPTARAGSRVRT